MGAVDRNASNSQRLRRNQQRGRAGGLTGGISVAAPLKNTGSQVQLQLLSAGGLTNNTGQLTLKLVDTSLVLSVSGVGVSLRASSGLQIATGLGVLVDPASTGLSLSAAGIKYTDPVTTKGDISGFSTVPARLPVGSDGQVLVADSTQALGVKWTTATGLAVSSFVFNEVPTGTVNGTNVTFTLANTPTAGTVRFFVNGILQAPTTDYTISGSTITAVVAPATGAILLAEYMK